MQCLTKFRGRGKSLRNLASGKIQRGDWITKLSGFWLGGVLFCAMSPLIWGQVSSGSISGTVKDSTGAVAPGVQVTIRNSETGTARVVQTDSAGHYLAPNVVPGNYEVKAELSGFQTEVRTGISLTLGREAVVDLSLKVGSVEERVVVTGEAPLVDTSSAAVAGLVDQQQVADLPLNGRSLTQLTTLQPGVYYYRSPNLASGAGQNITINGARTRQVNFLLNGTSVMNFFGKSPSGVSGDQLGVEAVREFTVLTSSYSAEFGRSAGGVINAITKSGTNAFHGSLFEYVRNSAVDARNFYDPRNVTPFKRNQFGGSFGGPIRKDNTFFFGTAEFLRERLGQTFILFLPTAAARQGILPGLPPFSVAASVKPYLDLLPIPTSQDLGNGIARQPLTYSQPTNENYVSGRIDHRFSDSDGLFGSYVLDDSDQTQLVTTPDYTSDAPWRNQYVSLEETHIFTPALLNIAHFGFNRSKDDQIVKCDDAAARLSFLGRECYILSVQGITAPSGGLGPRIFHFNSFQDSDMVSWTHGSHSVRFGGNYERMQVNGRQALSLGGRYFFPTLQGFLLGNPQYFEAPLAGINPQRGMRQNLFALFGNDTWRVRSDLTVNVGLRYEFVTSPTEVNGKLSNVPTLTSPARIGEPFFQNPSLLNFSPRVGIAWSPGASQNTSVRAGFGIFYDELLHNVWLDAPFQSPPFWNQGRVTSSSAFQVPFPNAYDLFLQGNVPNSPSFVFAMEGKPSQPYMMQYNLSVQRQLPGQIVVLVGYVGSAGRHLPRLVDNEAYPTILPDGKIFFPATSVRRNPNFQELRFRTFDTNSSYNSLQFGLRRRFAHGVGMQASYTWSKSLDMMSDSEGSFDLPNDNIFATIIDFPKLDKGRSAFDSRHNFSSNFTFDLPFGPGKALGKNMTAVGAKLLGGWQGQGIVSLQSGLPVAVFLGFDNARLQSTRNQERPDLKPGFSANSVVLGPPNRTKDPNGRYLNPAAFSIPAAGFLGNLGRGVFTGPGLATFDFSLIKNTAVTEKINLEFRSEFFNLLNRANFGSPNLTTQIAFTAPGQVAPIGTFSTITNTVTTSRQIQFALKLTF